MKSLVSSVVICLCACVAYCADTGKYWVENRIVYNTRLPHDRDGLKDDVDYFPDDFLKAIAACGMNGIWMRVDWRKIAVTTLTPATEDSKRRLAKLRTIADKCRRNGLGLWIFGNEPARLRKGDAFLADHPEVGGAYFPTHGSTMWCPSSPAAMKYVEESVGYLFSNVPSLAGFLNIAYGESLTTCLDAHECCDIDYYGSQVCAKCTKEPLWRSYAKTTDAVLRGIRKSGSDAPYISWFYQPMGTTQRKEWVFDCARNAPRGSTFMFNFESAVEEVQLGRKHCGSDYWLAKSRPGAPFSLVAAASKEGGSRLGAKIQTGLSHELATLPYVPVPGILYRKYAAMKSLGVKDVMQGWYFGGESGLMLKAAGMLSRDDFADGEDAFLMRLAREEGWGEDSELVVGLWKRFSDAFSKYPLDTQVQYYGPYHAGIVWQLFPSPVSENLARTWRPNEPPSGDRIGQCLGAFDVWEAETLALRMTEIACSQEVEIMLDTLAKRHGQDAKKLLELGVMRAFRLQLASAAAIFRFYRLRAEALHQSRRRKHGEHSHSLVKEMLATVDEECLRSDEMRKLSLADARLGFHAEAAKRLYDPHSLAKRIESLKKTKIELGEISCELSKGKTWPLSEREKTSAAAVSGKWIDAGKVRWRVDFDDAGNMVFSGECQESIEGVTLMLSDLALVRSPARCNISRPGIGKGFYAPELDRDYVKGFAEKIAGGKWRFCITSPKESWGRDEILRPSWIALVADTYLPMGKAQTLWPVGAPRPRGIGMLWADGTILGRIL